MPKTIKAPLTKQEAEKLIDEVNYLTVIVAVDFSDIVKNDLEGVLDLLSTAVTGSDVMMDITYKLVRAKEDVCYIEVSGDVTNSYDFKED